MSLYHKYRPQTPGQMFGNKTALTVLGRMLKGKDGPPHALLLTGPSGCGKTTIARMVATGGLRCHENEFREYNSANFNGIDTIRAVMANCDSRPLFGATKVFLYDEAHQISKPAQEAMLKMLEDSPDYVYHILATTNPDKLSTAIHTRCTEVKVASLKAPEMKALLEHVCKGEGFEFTGKELDAIVEVAGGSPRAGLVALEQASMVTGEMRLDTIGKASSEKGTWELYQSMNAGNWLAVVKCLQDLKEQEAEVESIRWAMLGIAKSQLVRGFNGHAMRVLSIFQFPFYDSKEPGLWRACGDVWIQNSKGAK